MIYCLLSSFLCAQYGWNALRYAAWNGHLNVVERLLLEKSIDAGAVNKVRAADVQIVMTIPKQNLCLFFLVVCMSLSVCGVCVRASICMSTVFICVCLVCVYFCMRVVSMCMYLYRLEYVFMYVRSYRHISIWLFL